MTDFAKRVGELSSEQRSLLVKRLREQTEAVSRNQLGRRRSEGENAPLSFAQQRLWFLWELDPGSAAYNVPLTLRIAGRLDLRAMRATLNEIVNRHESLRTSFEETLGRPVQVVAPELYWDFPVNDLSDRSAEDREAEAQRRALADSLAPFDLAHAPLFRIRLLQMSEAEHLLIMVFHHIIFDGWSWGILLREIETLYLHFAEGREALLADLSIQYPDFAIWQRESLNETALAKHLSYWKNNLGSDLPALDLPVDRERRPRSRSRGALESTFFDCDVARSVASAAIREGVTPFMFMLAAFGSLLSRYTGQENIIIATPIANRTQPELTNLIGFFANTILMRVDLTGDPTFRELLARVKTTATAAYSHQDLPFEKLVEDLHPARDVNKQPLFQVLLVMQRMPDMIEEPGGLAITPVEIHNGTSKCELTLSIQESAEGMTAVMEYDSDLFEAPSISRMLGCFQTLVKGALSTPELRVSSLPLLSPSEVQQIVVEWNDTETDYPRSSTIHTLFEHQVERTPDAIAVSSGGSHITYRQFNSRANQLAHTLAARGVRTESVVAICLDRSIELVCGLLAIVKAGAAYLPLDPAYPPQRLSFMMEDSGCSLLITSRDLVPQSVPIDVLYVDSDRAIIDSSSSDNPRLALWPDAAAYVIYTSGSTGVPKGVAITHSCCLNLVLWSASCFSNDQLRFMLASTSICFDLSVFELLLPLSLGSTVVLTQDALALASDPAASEVSFINTVPSAIAELLRLGAVPKSASTVALAGEPLPRHLVDSLYASGYVEQVWNLYGPTEYTTYTTYSLVGRGAGKPLIGRPVANTRLYVVDAGMSLLPMEVAGELLISGAGLARGYLNRPDHTAERFIPDPFSQVEGARLYRTGDLARYLPDGSLDYLGRLDHQVKVRGFRIEPGEVESHLRLHPLVRDCAVVALKGEPSEARLVAYVVSESGSDLPADELRGFLSTRLPGYMLPSAFVGLVSLPLTANGKLDRKALPLPDHARPALARSYVAPRFEVEQVLAAIWCEVLGLDQIGVYDNFFELGGDSILSIQVVARAQQSGIQVTPRQMIEHQTIEELAEVASEVVEVRADEGEAEAGAEVRLTPVQEWYFEWAENVNHFNHAMVLEVKEAASGSELRRIMQELLDRHEALRMRYEKQDGRWVQKAGGREEVSFAEIDISGLGEHEIGKMIKDVAGEVQTSLNIEEGRLMRVVHFRVGSGRDRVLIVIHHLAVDGVSWRILLEEIERGYDQMRRGQKIDLGAKTTSFSKWSRELRRLAESEDVTAQLGYWTEVINSSKPVSLRKNGNENASGTARTFAISLNESETLALMYETPDAYHTQINDILLTALAGAYRRWCGEEKVVIDVEGHGREDLDGRVDLTNTVGWFTAIYPVKLEVMEGEGLGERIKRIKEELRGVPGRRIGYGVLKYLSEHADVRASLRSSGEPDILFNYLGQWNKAVGNQTFVIADDDVGISVDPKNHGHHLVEINSVVDANRLTAYWTYSEDAFESATVAKLADYYKEELLTVIKHCTSLITSEYTPSDFPRAELSQKELDRLVAAIRHRRGDEGMLQVADIYDATPMQTGMLFHSIYSPGGGEYITQIRIRMAGNLDVSSMEKAWSDVRRRHSIFRVGFYWREVNKPVQVEFKDCDVTLSEVDLRGMEEPEKRLRLEGILAADRESGFVFEESPLMRLILVRTHDDSCEIIWSHYHLLLDGWSATLVLDEVFSAYEAHREGKKPQWEQRRDFKDYVGWLRQQNRDEAEKFWRTYLEGFVARTSFTSRRTPEKIGVRGETHDVYHKIDPALMALAATKAREHRLTLNTLMTGVWALLSSRYSGLDEVVFGVVTSGRPAGLKGVEQMVGLFINTLPMRVKVEPEQRVDDWLRGIQAEQAEMRRYEYTSLTEIQGWSEVPKGEPLFESIFAFENYPTAPTVHEAADALGVTSVVSNEMTNYPLTVAVVPGDEMVVRIAYDDLIFDAPTIQRIMKQVELLIEAIVNNPHGKVGDLDLLSEAERYQVIAEWNDTDTDYPRHSTIPALFEQLVQSLPDSVAVSCQGSHISYQELNSRANRLAHTLAARGVRAESVVAICLDRSIELVCGLLAIVKAGAAYLPLDSDYPAHRLSMMADQADASVLIASRATSKAAAALSHLDLILIDQDWTGISAAPNHDPRPDICPDNSAYIMFTSGSTGIPKGVIVTHRAVVRLVKKTNYVEAGPLDVWLELAPVTFDASTFEVWGCLLTGGRLSQVASSKPSLEEIASSLVSEQVSVAWLTAGLFHLMVDNHAESLSGLRYLLAGGDRLSPAHVRRFLDEVGEVSGSVLINGYGPTECTTFACHYSMSGGDGGSFDGSVPIGRPISNTRVYVLDQRSRPVLIGVMGEVCIAGDGLARGYLKSAELTAEKFVPDGVSGEAGRRMYRTGDVGRYGQDGAIEFIGRRDQQVKVRGYRVELGEVEAALLRQEKVKQAAVVAVGGGEAEGQMRLVAYVVGVDAERVEARELRGYLRGELPEYMQPGRIVQIDEMPLTRAGKVDRESLSRMKADDRGEWMEYEGPRTRMEELLAEIWEEVLGVGVVGVRENFFELGGDSILSIQVVARAQQAGMRITPRDVFERQTIEGLAEAAADGSVVAAVEEEAEVGTKVELTPIQEWYFGWAEKVDHFNHAMMLEVSEGVSSRELKEVMQAMVDRHEALRMRYEEEEGGRWRQRIGGGDELSYEEVDLRGRGEAEEEMKKVADEVQASLSVREGRLMKVVHFRMGTGRDRVLMVIHHLAVDGVSWGILMAEIELAYHQIKRGEPINLGVKTTSFRKWSDQLKAYGKRKEVRDQVRYWEKIIESIQGVPLDKSGGADKWESARTISVSLSKEETDNLLHEAAKAYHTQVNDILLTALAEAYRRWCGRASVVVDVEGHGREELGEGIDLTRTVGWFTTIYPVRLEVSEDEELAERIKRIKEGLREIPEKGIGYGVLKYLADDEWIRHRLSRKKSDIIFNYLGQWDRLVGQGPFAKEVEEGTGDLTDKQNPRHHLIEINIAVEAKELRAYWTYSDDKHERATIERLAEIYKEELMTLISHCVSVKRPEYTPSDFPLAELSQMELDDLRAAIRERRGEEGMSQVADIYEATPMQTGMLFHNVFSRGESEYANQIRITIDGDLDLRRMEKAWTEVCERHSVLRTAWFWRQVNKPHQVEYKDADIRILLEDWRAATAEERRRRLELYLKKDWEIGFECEEAPLMRLAVIRMEEEIYEMIWSHHHILLDGWSAILVLDEVFSTYEASGREDSPRLERKRDFKDYVGWLRQQNRDEAEAYWRAQLSGFREPTSLTPQRQTEKKQTRSDKRDVYHRVSSALTRLAATKAREHRLTLNTLMTGVWALLSSRYSGLDEVVFGVVTSGRPAGLKGVEQMVGLFINTLPMRVKVEAEQRVDDWLRGIQAEQAEMRRYEYTSLTEIQGWSEVPKGEPLFECVFGFENYPTAPSVYEGAEALGVTEVNITQLTHYPLTVGIIPGDEMLLKIEYDAARFDGVMVERMIRQIERALETMVKRLDGRVGAVELLTQQEQSQVLVEWNDTRSEYEDEKSLGLLFDEQVSLRHDAVAVVSGDMYLSYGELNRRADALAGRLWRAGLRAHQTAAICLERKPEMIWAMLGIIKAGAAYLPIDPEHPRDRIRSVLENADVGIIVTDSLHADLFESSKHRLVCLDINEGLAGQGGGGYLNSGEADYMAYVIYTSGSTGIPKGTAVTHRAVTRLVRNTNYVSIEAGDRVAQISNAAFDAATFEIWGALVNGASLVLISRDISLNPAEFEKNIREERITTLFLTTALFNQVARIAPGAFQTVREVMFGGEAVNPECVVSVLHRGGPGRLLHVYGPTENTTFSTWSRVDEVSDGALTIPIGRPISNTRVYVLNNLLEPMPVGVCGELCLAGDGLAIGYLKGPEQTAEKFVPDPYGKDGERLYRTGDIVKYEPGGEVVFIGRQDHQVKLRGFRVELGEIETAIQKHEKVKDAVVVQDGEKDQKQLVAYVAGNAKKPTENQIRDYLKERLPEYMLPSAFVILQELPMTPSGKINRLALPAFERTMPSSRSGYVPPETPRQRILADIWSRVLGVDNIGIHDSFFDLGGDSILSMQIIAKANQANIKLGPRQIFESPTIFELAQMVDAQAEAVGEEEATGPAPLTPIQEWYFDHDAVNVHRFNHAMLLKLNEEASRSVVERLFQEILDKHDALRSRFEFREGKWRQRIERQERLSYAEVDLSGFSEEKRAEAIAERLDQMHRSLNIVDGPLVRVVRFVLGGAGDRIAIVIHHIVVDAVSWRILLEDIQTAYDNLKKGRKPDLPARTTSYKKWSEELKKYAARRDVKEQLEYWEQTCDVVAPIPGRESTVSNLAGKDRMINLCLTEEETEKLLYEIRDAYETEINDVLLTALAVAYREWTGERSVVIDVEGHGREEIARGLDLTRTVGWFTAIYPVRLDVKSHATLGETLVRIKEQLRRIPDRGVGYGALKYLSEDQEVRDRLRAHRRRDVVFVYIGQWDQLISSSDAIVPTYEPTGRMLEETELSRHLLAVTAVVVDRCLDITLTYNENVHERSAIEDFAEAYRAALRSIISHCLSVSGQAESRRSGRAV